MSKDMTPALEEAAQESEIMTRMLVTIYAANTANGQPFRFVANDNKDLTMPDGTLYVSTNITRGDIASNTDGDKEQVSLKLTNKWQEWAAYMANNGKALKGCRCVIEDVFLDHLEEGAVWRFEGVMDKLSMVLSDFSCNVTRDIVDYEIDAPNMDYGPTCQLTYGDSRCRATNTNGPCDQTITTCEALGNILRYQGHPSTPMQMVIRSS
jgi:hypothetical protein